MLLLSIESFAAVVGDNDGAAFITKAEFDSLKSTFQEQINRYNRSIDNKIDGAIASYLNGVQTAKQTTEKLIFNDWNTVTCLNYPFETNYCPLLLNATYEEHHSIKSKSKWWQTIFIYMTLKTGRMSNLKGVVNVVNAGEEKTTSPSKVYWRGLSYDYQDALNVSISKNVVGDNFDESGTRKVEWAYGFGLTKYYLVRWGQINGLGQCLEMNDRATDIWSGAVYKYSKSGSTDLGSGVATGNLVSYPSASANATAVLGTDANGKTLSYEHIITYDVLNDISVCDPYWTRTLVSSNKVTASSMVLDSFSGKWSGVETNLSNGTAQYIKDVDGKYRGDFGSDYETTNIPTVGLLSSKYSTSNIMQFDSTVLLDNNNIISSLKDIPVVSGLCLLDGKDGQEITWSPVFKNFKFNGAEVSEPINMQLSMEPWTNSVQSTTNLINVSVDGGSEIQTISVNPGDICKLNWVMPKDGVVYAKWWPANADTLNGKWSIDLDISNCRTYILKNNN